MTATNLVTKIKFKYKSFLTKIEFKYIDIKDLINNIKNNTISETDAKKSLNALNKIKNAEIKYKRLIPGQKELLNLFNDLSDIILTDKTLMSSKDENEKLKEEKENENLKEKKRKWRWKWKWEWEWRWWWRNKNINIFKWVWWRNKSKQKK